LIATADASFSKTRTRGATFCVEEEGSDDVEGRKRAVSSFGGATKALMVESVRGFAAPATRDAVRWERRTCLGKVAAALRAERVLSWGMGKDGGVLPWRCQVFELWPVLSCGGRERDERPSNSAHAFLGSRVLFLLSAFASLPAAAKSASESLHARRGEIRFRRGSISRLKEEEKKAFGLTEKKKGKRFLSAFSVPSLKRARARERERERAHSKSEGRS
jgi:hypothetical protein